MQTKKTDLENAINQMNDKSVEGADGGSLFKLQAEVARPFDKNRKRACDQSSGLKQVEPNIQKNKRPNPMISVFKGGIHANTSSGSWQPRLPSRTNIVRLSSENQSVNQSIGPNVHGIRVTGSFPQGVGEKRIQYS
ncbi:hypothetical protein Nepgr_018931 [Nepenthes gracilis]|uniref:Uncharacterized protein n=1 Tax=Nepenthes gracilis TaxID=150966 RepID=A0AAD3SSD6_NEPGR|nr:hypothetical protein Nepgr_018931 [Nepenthes gracilis]